jgi:hypothetical protein
MQTKSKNRKLLISYAISIIACAFLIYFHLDSIEEMRKYVRGADFRFLGIAFLFVLGAVLPQIVRLRQIWLYQGIVPELNSLTGVVFAGFFFQAFFPSDLGADTLKAVYASRLTPHKSAAVFGVFLDRAFGILSLMVMACLGALFSNLVPARPLVFGISSGFILAALTVTFAAGRGLFDEKKTGGSRFYRLFHSVIDRIRFLRPKTRGALWKLFTVSLLLSLGSHLLSTAGWYFTGRALDLHLNFMSLFIFLPVATIACIVIPSVNGIGVRETAAMLILGGSVISSAMSLTLSALFSALVTLLGIVGLGVALFTDFAALRGHFLFNVKKPTNGV